jgi:hypothetical protein
VPRSTAARGPTRPSDAGGHGCQSRPGLARRPNLAGRPSGARAFSYLEARRAGGPDNASMLLSFERPASAGSRSHASKDAGRDGGAGRRSSLSTVLENCTEATSAAIDKRRLKRVSPGPHGPASSLCPFTGCLRERTRPDGPDHRQDSKGTRWMPWHQESKKGVNGCDKPRLGAE